MSLAKILTKQVSILTIFSVLAYAMAYYFQKGVASYYGYPDLFVKIDLNTLLYSAIWLLIFSFLFLGALYATLMFDLKEKYYVPFVVFIAVILIPNFYVIGFHWPFGYFSDTSVMNVGDILLFAMLFLNYHNVVSSSIHSKRHEHHMDSIRKFGRLAEYKDVFYYLDLKILKSAFPLGVATLLILSHTFGKVTAFKNSEYYAVDGSNTKVLLNSFGSGFVVGECESNNAKFEFINDLKGMSFKIMSSKKEISKLKECFETRVKNKG
ncbi:TPA: hypothetical protein ACTXAA_000636 [Raoultella planticola]|jgi:hypothetical protein